MKPVTRVINQSKISVEQHEIDLGNNSGKDKPDIKMNNQSPASATQCSFHTHPKFSKTFSNCTINVCFK